MKLAREKKSLLRDKNKKWINVLKFQNLSTFFLRSSRWRRVISNNEKKCFKRRWPKWRRLILGGIVINMVYIYNVLLYFFYTVIKCLRYYFERGMFLHAQTKVTIYHILILSRAWCTLCSGQWSVIWFFFYIFEQSPSIVWIKIWCGQRAYKSRCKRCSNVTFPPNSSFHWDAFLYDY